MLRVQLTFVQKGQGRGAFIDLKQWVQFRPWKKYSSGNFCSRTKTIICVLGENINESRVHARIRETNIFHHHQNQKHHYWFLWLLMRSLELVSASSSTNKSSTFITSVLAVKRQILHQHHFWLPCTQGACETRWLFQRRALHRPRCHGWQWRTWVFLDVVIDIHRQDYEEASPSWLLSASWFWSLSLLSSPIVIIVLSLTFHEPPRTWKWRRHSSPGRERSCKGSLAALACEDHVVEGRTINSSELLILSSLFVLLWVQIKFLFVLERWWSVLEEIQRLQLLKSYFISTRTVFWNVEPEGFPSAAWAFCPCPASSPCPSTSRPACTPPQPDRGADEHFHPLF